MWTWRAWSVASGSRSTQETRAEGYSRRMLRLSPAGRARRGSRVSPPRTSAAPVLATSRCSGRVGATAEAAWTRATRLCGPSRRAVGVSGAGRRPRACTTRSGPVPVSTSDSSWRRWSASPGSSSCGGCPSRRRTCPGRTATGVWPVARSPSARASSWARTSTVPGSAGARARGDSSRCQVGPWKVIPGAGAPGRVSAWPVVSGQWRTRWKR